MNITGPVNGMSGAMDRLEAETGLISVILASAKKTFFATGFFVMLYPNAVISVVVRDF